MQRRRFAALALGALAPTAWAQRSPATVSGPAPGLIRWPTSPLAVPSAADRLLQMQPMVSTRRDETHSCLAVTTSAFGAAGSAYQFSGRMRTVRQLRAVEPNAWEVAWLVWNYVDNDHLYYFILKPNGWEVGKRDPRYVVPGVNDGQKIMATGESIKGVIGRWYTFDIRIAGVHAEIYIDGVFVCRFHDTDAQPLLAGRAGLYCEDALCQWNSITAPVVDSFDMEPIQPFVDGSQLTYWRIAFLGYGSGGIVAA